MAVNATLPAPPELCHIPGTALPVKRLKALDVLLLLVLLPAWGAALALHVCQIYRGRLAWVGVFVAAPATRTEHPTVRGFWPGTDGAASGLLVGDRLVRPGRAAGADLRLGGHVLARLAGHVSPLAARRAPPSRAGSAGRPAPAVVAVGLLGLRTARLQLGLRDSPAASTGTAGVARRERRLHRDAACRHHARLPPRRAGGAKAAQVGRLRALHGARPRPA